MAVQTVILQRFLESGAVAKGKAHVLDADVTETGGIPSSFTFAEEDVSFAPEVADRVTVMGDPTVYVIASVTHANDGDPYECGV